MELGPPVDPLIAEALAGSIETTCSVYKYKMPQAEILSRKPSEANQWSIDTETGGQLPLITWSTAGVWPAGSKVAP